MREIDLMKSYPQGDREAVLREREGLTDEERAVARQFGKEYFDGPRRLGLGGYKYDQKFYSQCVKDFIEFYALTNKSSILEIGCRKGFMLHDFSCELPENFMAGVEMSDYCREAFRTIWREMALHGDNYYDLKYGNNTFDLVYSVNNLAILDAEDIPKAIKEIMRVSRKHKFIKVNAYRTPEEKERLEKWNLVSKVIWSVDKWKEVFEECGYDGEYAFWAP